QNYLHIRFLETLYFSRVSGQPSVQLILCTHLSKVIQFFTQTGKLCHTKKPTPHPHDPTFSASPSYARDFPPPLRPSP
ncbi:MAG TPA: hypothetical protein DDW51_03540, partial [Cyanobacteria bacterium UBA11367]|nr:hypothetical protein [Cyanobacteria bacterium UBA11367]